MKGEPQTPVVCDRCDYEEYFDMTPLAGGAYDNRSLDIWLQRAGWHLSEDGEDVCPECAEGVDS